MSHHSAIRPLPVVACVVMFAALSAFGTPTNAQPDHRSSGVRFETDPVADAVSEASRRFGVPEPWIRSVMRVESAGRVEAVSHAGAMGLMQVMPATYAELRSRYGLGPDPFAVRDNILAGTAYLREMFDRYGAHGMLAAYNAGPGRWEDHVARGRPLPGETVGYLARLAPMLGVGSPEIVQTSMPLSVAPTPQPSIFAAVRSTADDRNLADEQASLQRIVFAKPTIVLAEGELFARRQSAAPLQPGQNSANGAGAAEQTIQGSPPTSDLRPSLAQNPIFPASISRQRRP